METDTETALEVATALLSIWPDVFDTLVCVARDEGFYDAHYDLGGEA